MVFENLALISSALYNIDPLIIDAGNVSYLANVDFYAISIRRLIKYWMLDGSCKGYNFN